MKKMSPKYVKIPEGEDMKEDKAAVEIPRGEGEEKGSNDKVMGELLKRTEILEEKLKVEEQDKIRRDKIMEEKDREEISRLIGSKLSESMKPVEDLVKTLTDKDRQTHDAETKKREREETEQLVDSKLEARIAPIQNTVSEVGSKLTTLIDCKLNPEHPDCIFKSLVPGQPKPEEETKWETKIKEQPKEEPEIKEVDIDAEVEKRIKEQKPKGVLGTDLTLEEFLKDEKSQEVFVDKYLGEAGMQRALERCTSKECQNIREIARQKGINIQKKREGGGMLGGDWEDIR